MEKIKSNSVLIIAVAVVLLFVGFLVVGNTTARADGVKNIFCSFSLAGCEFTPEAFSQVLVNVLPEPEDALGSGSSHATDPCMVVGGVERCYSRQIMVQGTTTICSFISPSATSTVTGGLVSFEVGSTTSLEVTVAKASTNAATTTTLISDVTLAANIHGTIHIDTAVAATLDATQIIAPLNYVNVGIKGNVVALGEDYTGSKVVGSCSVEFMVI